ncbi:transposase, MuDR, MULE transposase domain protein [Tanacetum coccineum]
MSFKPDIPETPLFKSKPLISKDYQKETEVKVGNIFDNKEALDLAIRLKALNEGYQFLNDRSTPQRKLPVLKLAETYRAMVQEWYYKRRKLAGTCQCRKWQLSGLPCGHVIAVTRFTSPPRRSFVGGLVATVDPVELERFSTNQVKRILTYSLGYDENSPTFLYLRKPNCSLDSGLVPLADALQDRNMLLTYAQSHQNRLHVVACKIQLFVSHHQIDLSTVLIPNDGSLEEAFAEALDEEYILADQILTTMHRYADRFTNRRVQINNLMVLQDHPLVDYGKYALGCMTGAGMKKCVHLKSVRDELLRSMEEKRQLMANYRDM